MKIAFFSVAHFSYGGGFEEQLHTLAIALSQNGHQVSVLTSTKKFTKILAILLSFLYLKPRFSITEFKDSSNFHYSKNNISTIEFSNIFNLYKILENYDVVYVKNEILENFVLRLAITKRTPPIICGMHTVLEYSKSDNIITKFHNFIYTSTFYFWLIDLYAAYHCINKDQVKILKKKIKRKSIFLIRNFISTSPTMVRQPGKLFTVLFVGRLSYEKGIDYFIDLITHVSKKNIFKSLRFVICGSGAYIDEVIKLSKKFPEVSYMGHVEKKRLTKLYQKSDVFLSLSRGETFGLTILEAQSYGLPVIAFNIQGVRDIISNGKSGYLIDIGNLDEVVNKLLVIRKYKVSNFTKYMSISHYSYNYISKFYSKKYAVRQYEAMFKKVYKNYEEN